MKISIIIFLIFSLTFYQGQSQVIQKPTELPQKKSYDFSLKQKRQKTAAWICLGSGFVMTIAGLVINSTDDLTKTLTFNLVEVEKVHKGDWLIYLGSATTLASIPLFISAGKNKKKATLSFKGGPSIFRSSNYKGSQKMSISLRIDF